MEWLIWAMCAAIVFKIIKAIFGFAIEIFDIFKPRMITEPVDTAAQQSNTGLFEITYQDRVGTITKRRIKPYFCNGDPDPLITAYCERADGVRSFRASRVIECVDLETGEVIESFVEHMPRGAITR